jgi:hypothetical protein
VPSVHPEHAGSTQRHGCTGCRSSYGTDGSTPTDVFYASRLPFDPGSPTAASYVEGHWSPALLRFPENAQAKAELNSALNYLARKAQRNLSLSGGASIVIRASHAGHHPFGLGWIRCKTTKATLSDRPHSSSYAGKTLARIPPGEGLGFIDPALAADRRLCAGKRRGGSRFGKERLGIDRHQHGCVLALCQAAP